MDFLYFLDILHSDGTCSRERVSKELQALANAYGKYKGSEFDKARFLKSFEKKEEPKELADIPENTDFETLMDWYAAELLRQVPCMRMSDSTGRRMLTENPNLKGIVYHTVKFCDFYGFEYAELRKNPAIPLLKIESDYTCNHRLWTWCNSNRR